MKKYHGIFILIVVIGLLISGSTLLSQIHPIQKQATVLTPSYVLDNQEDNYSFYDGFVYELKNKAGDDCLIVTNTNKSSSIFCSHPAE